MSQMMGVSKWIRENKHKYKEPEKLRKACRMAMKADCSTVYAAWQRIKDEEKKMPVNKRGITEEELRAKHDIKYIVTNKAKELKKGIYLTDREFIEMCNLRAMPYRSTLEQAEFDKYHGKAGSNVYWSHPDSIKKAKDDGIII